MISTPAARSQFSLARSMPARSTHHLSNQPHQSLFHPQVVLRSLRSSSQQQAGSHQSKTSNLFSSCAHVLTVPLNLLPIASTVFCAALLRKVERRRTTTTVSFFRCIDKCTAATACAFLAQSLPIFSLASFLSTLIYRSILELTRSLKALPATRIHVAAKNSEASKQFVLTLFHSSNSANVMAV